MMDPIMILMDPSLRGSPDFDPEADYQTQDASYYNELEEFTKYEWLNNRKRGEHDS